jgi:sulfate/thiosulfate transport system substrate-binding protein
VIYAWFGLLSGCEVEGEAPQADAAKVEEKAAGKARKLTLAAYTTPREAYAQILPAFAKHWKEKTGEDVSFEESYQGSGAQARAVVEGFEADVVALSLEPDVRVIEKAGLITHDFTTKPNGGMVSRSLVVIAVRPGNPKGIADWSDLGKAEVEVLTPNVKTSGGAMWNVMAIYGSATRAPGGTPAAAEALLGSVLGRVSVMDKGARESIVTFEKGKGDAAITYENEVLVSRAAGKAMDYVVPPSTIVIENPVAVVDTYVDKHGNRDVAEGLVTFLGTPEAQAMYVQHGLRPIDETPIPAELPTPASAFTVKDLGGWDEVKKALFDKDALYDRAIEKAQAGK